MSLFQGFADTGPTNLNASLFNMCQSSGSIELEELGPFTQESATMWQPPIVMEKWVYPEWLLKVEC